MSFGPYEEPQPVPAAFHGDPFPPKRSRRPKVFAALGALAILLLGVGIGSASRPAAAPPEVRTETVTKEVKVYKTPPSCLTALDLNEAAFSYASDAMGAISRGDYTASGTATQKINDIAPASKQAKADCRAANQ